MLRGPRLHCPSHLTDSYFRFPGTPAAARTLLSSHGLFITVTTCGHSLPPIPEAPWERRPHLNAHSAPTATGDSWLRIQQVKHLRRVSVLMSDLSLPLLGVSPCINTKSQQRAAKTISLLSPALSFSLSHKPSDTKPKKEKILDTQVQKNHTWIDEFP